jgi:hypothetical protein
MYLRCGRQPKFLQPQRENLKVETARSSSISMLKERRKCYIMHAAYRYIFSWTNPTRVPSHPYLKIAK